MIVKAEAAAALVRFGEARLFSDRVRFLGELVKHRAVADRRAFGVVERISSFAI